MQETQEVRFRSLGQEDPLMEEMATHSSILAWENPMDRGAWQATVHQASSSQTGLSHNSELVVQWLRICLVKQSLWV